MNNIADVNHIIVPGMRQLGLEPKDLKYIVLTHQYADHYGGINRLMQLAPKGRSSPVNPTPTAS